MEFLGQKRNNDDNIIDYEKKFQDELDLAIKESIKEQYIYNKEEKDLLLAIEKSKEENDLNYKNKIDRKDKKERKESKNLFSIFDNSIDDEKEEKKENEEKNEKEKKKKKIILLN